MATAKRLKYLGVEMLRCDATKSSKPEVGLFRGLRTRTDGEGATAKILRLIILGTKDKENSIKALNLDVFNVLSLKMLYGDTKELIVFKANDVDQEKAMELLELALVEFQEEKRMVDNDPEIIDVKTFDDVPKEFFSEEEKKSGANKTYEYNNQYNSQCGHTNSSWQEKEAERKAQKAKEDKLRQIPTLIQRGKTEELPALKIMNSMKKKIAAIASGEYDYELVDPDPEDTFGDEKKSSTVK